MDPSFHPPPPQYSQIQQHQRLQASLVEVNELGPTIQQGVIPSPVRGAQPDKETRSENETQTRSVPQNRRGNNGNHTSGLEENGEDILPTHNDNPFPDGYIRSCIHEGRQLPLNNVARPVFMNHYYAGEPVVPVMNKRYIRLDECDISSESAVGIQQPQAMNCEFTEHSQESLVIQRPSPVRQMLDP